MAIGGLMATDPRDHVYGMLAKERVERAMICHVSITSWGLCEDLKPLQRVNVVW
jgi:hypothetical protein